ncbi:hypothetical protein [Nocardioides sp. TF02-7]|uniref:hypothetical protein n=1 Tax=Nocardioides sp. TF02-7 TaxID=2917724 RepID=UPI001F060C2A|nr:hypothetical protein [Nocardioides sp. TF02-7]UMG91609.1 hypothetical protein MF408_16105 [Nocardioides sp. TF02-7]
MPGVLRGLSIAVLLTALPVTAGVLTLGADDPEPPPAPAYTSTPLAEVDTTTLAVARAPFCDLLPEEAVVEALGGSEALGGAESRVAAYGNGERARIAPGVRDVAHEYGCRLTAAGSGAEAQAWVFAPPVTADRARDLAAEAADVRRCERQPDAPALGEPTVALVCGAGDRRTASFRGLLGDAWLACSVTAPESVAEPDLVDRAGRFCVAVARAAAPAAEE